MIGIDLLNSRELRATFLAVRNAAPEIQKWLRLSLKQISLPEWQGALRQSRATTAQSRVLVDTAKVKVSNQNIRLSAGDAAKRLSGGGKARDLAHGEEFGGQGGDRVKSYTSRRGGKSFQVRNRHTTRQFPARRRNGYVAFPAATIIIPRIASLAAQTVVRSLLDLVDGKAGQ